MSLPLFVMVHTKLDEIAQYLFGGFVFTNSFGGVEEVHVGAPDDLLELEILDEIFTGVPLDEKVHVFCGTVVGETGDGLLLNKGVQVFFVILGPPARG